MNKDSVVKPSVSKLLSVLKSVAPVLAGFTLGGLLWCLISVVYPGPYPGIFVWLAGSAIFGFVGGYFLDIRPHNRLKMASYGAVGFVIGMLFMMIGIDRLMLGDAFIGGILFAPGVTAGGFAIGLVLDRIGLFGALSTVGYIAGGLLGVALYQGIIWLFHANYLPFIEPLPIMGMVIGLGIGMGIVMGLGKYIVEKKSGSSDY